MFCGCCRSDTQNSAGSGWNSSNRLMDLYQLKSPRIQKLMQDLLLREEPQFQEVTYKMPKGRRASPWDGCSTTCSVVALQAHKSLWHSRRWFPSPGRTMCVPCAPMGIAQYGILELAWKSLPEADLHLTNELSYYGCSYSLIWDWRAGLFMPTWRKALSPGSRPLPLGLTGR